jgi:hypothetical protein
MSVYDCFLLSFFEMIAFKTKPERCLDLNLCISRIHSAKEFFNSTFDSTFNSTFTQMYLLTTIPWTPQCFINLILIYPCIKAPVSVHMQIFCLNFSDCVLYEQVFLKLKDPKLWRDSIPWPVAPISSVVSGDDATKLRRQGLFDKIWTNSFPRLGKLYINPMVFDRICLGNIDGNISNRTYVWINQAFVGCVHGGGITMVKKVSVWRKK